MYEIKFIKMKKTLVIFFGLFCFISIAMSFYTYSNYFVKTFEDTHLDKCNDNDNRFRMEEGDNLKFLNKVILYLYRYSAVKSECSKLKNKTIFTFAQNLEGIFLLPGDFLLPRMHHLFYKTNWGSNFLYYGYFCTSMDVYINGKPQKIENLVKIKEPHKNMWFCFNPNYSLSFILSLIIWGIIFIIIYNKFNKKK